MFELTFDNEIKIASPGLRVLMVEAEVSNGPTPDALWQEIETEGHRLRETVPMDQVNKLPGIMPTRQAYKACGKEPNCYRPSAEALTRRMVKGVDLYRTLTIIDLINLLSLRTGHSIGGFDADYHRSSSSPIPHHNPPYSLFRHHHLTYHQAVMSLGISQLARK